MINKLDINLQLNWQKLEKEIPLPDDMSDDNIRELFRAIWDSIILLNKD